MVELVKNVKPEAADNSSFLRVEELAFEQLRATDPYDSMGHARDEEEGAADLMLTCALYALSARPSRGTSCASWICLPSASAPFLLSGPLS